MEDRYRVETTHDEGSFYALAQMQSNLYEADRNRRLTLAAYVCIAAGGVAFVLFRQSTIAFMPVIIGCGLLVWQGSRARTRAKRMTENAKAGDPSVLYRFAADGFHVKNAQRQGRASYDSVVNIARDGEHYFLFINESTAHLFRKTDFTRGDPETFTAFIESATGLKMQHHPRKKTVF